MRFRARNPQALRSQALSIGTAVTSTLGCIGIKTRARWCEWQRRLHLGGLCGGPTLDAASRLVPRAPPRADLSGPSGSEEARGKVGGGFLWWLDQTAPYPLIPQQLPRSDRGADKGQFAPGSKSGQNCASPAGMTIHLSPITSIRKRRLGLRDTVSRQRWKVGRNPPGKT